MIDFAHAASEASALYRAGVRPALADHLLALNLDKDFIRAQGHYLYYCTENGEDVAVLDLMSGDGSALLGHNHPDLKNEIFDALEKNSPAYLDQSCRLETAKLARRLNQEIMAESYQNYSESFLLHLEGSHGEALDACITHLLLSWKISRDRFFLSASIDDTESQKGPILLSIGGSCHGRLYQKLALEKKHSHRSQYQRTDLQTLYLPWNAGEQAIKSFFQDCHVKGPDGKSHSRIAGLIIEPIQLESGVRMVPAELADLLGVYCRRYGVPLIVDERRAGLFRTGRLLASQSYDIKPDYILLGNSIGGGLCRMAAVLIKTSLYQTSFESLHECSLSEADFSSRVCHKLFDLLAQEEHLSDRAEEFETRIRQTVMLLRRLYPKVRMTLHGAGFLLGLHVDFDRLPNLSRRLLAFRERQMLSSVFASFLFHAHQVRVATCRHDHETLRLEPPFSIKDQEIKKIERALHALVHLLDRGDYDSIAQYINDEPPRQAEPACGCR